jgi:hypothetical protein
MVKEDKFDPITKRTIQQWGITRINQSTTGKNFQDCKEAMRTHVDKYLDLEIVGERVLSMEKTFNMKKNDVASLPPSANSVIVGLGWTCTTKTDFDASIICLDSEMKKRISSSMVSKQDREFSTEETTQRVKVKAMMNASKSTLIKFLKTSQIFL